LEPGTVVLQHPFGGHLRVNPGRPSQADAQGGRGLFARWSLEVHGQNLVKLKSLKSGKYLRIIQNGRLCDVAGLGGKFTFFTYDAMRKSLESQQFPGCFLAVNQQQKPRVVVLRRQESKQQNGSSLHFDIIRIDEVPVVLRHGFDRSLRVRPGDEHRICGHGERGKFARWTMECFGNGSKAKFKSTKSGKYLRIIQDGKRKNAVVDVGGSGGVFTEFKYDASKHSLESVQFPGTFLAVQKGTNSVIAVQPQATGHDEDISMRFELVKLKGVKSPSKGKRVKKKQNADGPYAVIESQRQLIQQQQRLISQLQRTVDSQQQIISQLTGHKPVAAASHRNQQTLDNDGEWDEEDTFEHVTVPGATKK